MTYRLEAIPESVAAEVRATMRAPGYGHPAHREVATGTGPCRLCLRTFEVGREERILFTYQPFTAPGTLPSPGPVFIHAAECPRYEVEGLPESLRALPLVYDAYGEQGRLIAQERVGPAETEPALAALVGRTDVTYVHVRHGEAGCFVARVTR